jgi:uncharacterized protein
MTAVFADTFLYVALLSRSDRRHQLALDWATQTRTRIVTTQFILLEVANFCRSPRDRQRFSVFIEAIHSNRVTTAVPCTASWFDKGQNLFSRRLDKEWSLTDCISFVVMEEHGLTQALTNDHHFEQAGFEVLL